MSKVRTIPTKSAMNILLEQYKLYVEMADRISERRDKANAFFLTLNTLAITAIGFLWEKHPFAQPKCLIVLPLIALLTFCWFWRRLVKSYRQLNSVKFLLIGELEQKLPAQLWRTEWQHLGQGQDPNKYAPLSELEEKVPMVFGVIYLVVAAAFFWG